MSHNSKKKERNGQIYSSIRDKYLSLTPEEKVRQQYVSFLISYYGYSVEQMGEEFSVSNSNRGQGRMRADIVIWKSKEDKQNNKNAFIVVECKAEYINIKKEDYFQGCNYARQVGANFFITTNEKETKFFRVNKETIPNQLDEITNIPMANEVNNEKKIKELLEKLKVFERDEFAKLLQKCHDIIRNNNALSPEAAFDEISKILFIKIRYEKQNKNGIKFSLEEFEKLERVYNLAKSQNSQSFMQQIFQNTKEDLKSDKLFDDNEIIKIKKASFKSIVKELEKYDLSNTSDDIKGIAFEKFLGTTFRGELGQFFTPRPIVNYIVELLDPLERELICDPCCGSGGFLIKAFEYIREKIEKEIKNEKIKYQDKENFNEVIQKLNSELDLSNTNSRIYKLSHNYIFGTDANPRMARVSKMNMIMHGDGHNGIHHHNGLLNVSNIFEGKFDVILTNPPFGANITDDIVITKEDIQEQKKIIEKNKDKNYFLQDNILTENDLNYKVNARFKIGSKLTEVLFIERCLNLLKKGGRMGIVLPEGVLNASNLQKCRDFVEGKAKIIMITSISQDTFKSAGASVKTSLLFFKKFTVKEEKKYSKIKKQATNEVNKKYENEIKKCENLKAKEKKQKLKKIEIQKETEIKKIIKEKFNYQIPIAKIENVGITTTGKETKNDLIELLKEFKEYTKNSKLWETKYKAKSISED